MTTADRPLNGKTVLITGAARRIGAEIASVMHGAGANVVLHYRRSKDDAEALAARFNGERKNSAVTAPADLLDLSTLPALIHLTLESFGRLDVLVNNASSFYPTPIGTITPEQWDDLIGSNVRAPVFLSQAAAAALRLTQGLILNLADIHALRPLRRHPVYCIAKAGLVMATRSLARELGPDVRVNAIAPGPVLWPDEESTGSEVSAALKADIVHRTALKRTGGPGDIASAALYFATAAPYVTGQILAVDGGRSLGF